MEAAPVAIETINLPIDPLLPEIVRAVQNNPITLLEAEPGAGKTTRVPAALVAAGLNDIYVLEPRRIAARMAARRVAEEAGERTGESIGYQVRFEQVGGAATKLWFVTEGVLTRKLLGEGGLGRTRVVILDEFHERHLETDLALALLRRLQQTRNDLRLLIMSATLEGETLRQALGNPRLITAPGKLHPVAVRYTPASPAPLEQQVASAVEIAMTETDGHILVFLPGAAEIRRALQACEGIARRTRARLLPLHGELSPDQQDAAVAPSRERKIICATNVAESSITIEGVTAVIDSGLARVLTHSQWSGFSRLQVTKISKSSAIQRAGRAGRTGAGIAIRLYSEADFERRAEQIPPEILRSDLAQTALLLAANGMRWSDLPWLDAPPEEMRRQAEELLVRLEALDTNGVITTTGRKMSKLAIHPRLGRFVLSAAEGGHAHDACKVAAVLSEGRFRPDEAARGTFASDIDALLAADLSYSAERLARQLAGSVPRKSAASGDSASLEKALLRAFPDRVARRRGETLLLSNGSAAQLDHASHLHGDFLAAIEIDDRSDRAAPLVRLASAIEPDWLLEFFPDRVTTSEDMAWNRESERVEQVNALLYDQLVIDESRSVPSDREAASRFLAAKVLEAGIERFVDADDLRRFMNRVEFAGKSSGIRIPEDLMAVSVAELAAGIYTFSDFRAAANQSGIIRVLQSKLPMRQIDEVAPEFIRLPSGRRARIEYHQERPPSVASRLQDFFGMRETPTVARGAVPLVVHLLAPNQRPVQVTTDLVSFWKTLYPQVRRELSRRYPKHMWPEIPA